MKDILFINAKHVPNLGKSFKRYTSHNGVLKEFKLGVLSSKLINKKDIWYNLSDLPKYLQDKLNDKALTREEIFEIANRVVIKQDIMDKNDVRVYVTENTEIMPIVGNFLPSDGVYAYTIVTKNNQIILKPLLVLSNYHWSDLFAGHTKFGKNVFCLVEDLTPEQRKAFKDEIIMLKDALDFLEEKNLVRKRDH